MKKANFRLQQRLIKWANKLKTTPSGVATIDNVNVFSKEYLESYGKGTTVDYILSNDGWIDVTDENAQEIADELQRAVNLDATKREQDELNGENNNGL